MAVAVTLEENSEHRSRNDEVQEEDEGDEPSRISRTW